MKGKKKKRKVEHFQFSYVLPCAVSNPYDILKYVHFPLEEPDIETVTPFQQWFAEKYFPKEKG